MTMKKLIVKHSLYDKVFLLSHINNVTQLCIGASDQSNFLHSKLSTD